jgi:hypothetical protein
MPPGRVTQPEVCWGGLHELGFPQDALSSFCRWPFSITGCDGPRLQISTWLGGRGRPRPQPNSQFPGSTWGDLRVSQAQTILRCWASNVPSNKESLTQSFFWK